MVCPAHTKQTIESIEMQKPYTAACQCDDRFLTTINTFVYSTHSMNFIANVPFDRPWIELHWNCWREHKQSLCSRLPILNIFATQTVNQLHCNCYCSQSSSSVWHSRHMKSFDIINACFSIYIFISRAQRVCLFDIDDSINNAANWNTTVATSKNEEIKNQNKNKANQNKSPFFMGQFAFVYRLFICHYC